MSKAAPTITLCMIAKDEERWIEQAISSVKSIVSEVIVVDTGSTDGTVAQAEKLGAKVLFRPWDDDFSAPRNLSLKKATSDWILVLDCDELIAPSDLDEIKKLTTQKGVCYEFMQRHYTNDQRLSGFTPCRGEYPEYEKGVAGYFESNCCRLFPNHAGLNFQGRVHELVEHSIRQLGQHKVVRTRVPIHHFGHTDEVKQKKNKGLLYTPLGAKKVQEQPQTWKAHHELGIEHNCNGRLEESAASFMRALQLESGYVPTWINLGYVLCEMGRHDQALDALHRALLLDRTASEAHCNIGVVHMRTGRWTMAAESFRRAIELKNDYVNAYSNLGKVFLELKLPKEAIAIYQKTLSLTPQNAMAKAELGVAYMQLKQFELAEKNLSEALSAAPEVHGIHFHLGQLYLATKRAKDALSQLEKFCAGEEKSPTAKTPAGVQFLQSVKSTCEKLRQQSA